MRRKLTDSMQYPAFVLLASVGVMLFFILFVLPQFSTVLQDFGSKSDNALSMFIALSDFPACQRDGRASDLRGGGGRGWWLLRRPGASAALISLVSRLPGIASVFQYYRASIFCRNLGVLLSSGVALTATLRILIDIMATAGGGKAWAAAADRVRHGGKLSEAPFGHERSCPRWRSACCASVKKRTASHSRRARSEFYEAKLQRSLDRIVAVIGPLAIIMISTVVGGLIVSVMTALLSVTQLVG